MKQGAESTPPLLRFWSPRYWPTWLLLLWFYAAAQLPFRANVRLHKLLGRAGGALLGSSARVARRNLELCFPERPAADIDALLRRHFEAMGACIGETAFAWFASLRRLRVPLDVEGQEHLDAALRRGRGVLLFTGHFTGLEMTGPLLNSLTDRFTFMFSGRRNPLLDVIQRRRRARIAKRWFPKDDVRGLLLSLRDNCVVWYAADQFYRGKRGELVDFFHEPAVTNTAVSRLASISGAAVLPFFYRRRADDSGYVLTFNPPPPDFPSGDPAADTRRLILLLEAAIRRSPEQYWWSHKRFRDRPAALPDAYAASAAGVAPSPPQAGAPAVDAA
ncbi:MAG: lipid A biosynthesis acyltransferase [Gammaproteobacteria bacterium]|nr:lipid A biosynthesis acyltransferase [Gammaproteobacteria bacterium]